MDISKKYDHFCELLNEFMMAAASDDLSALHANKLKQDNFFRSLTPEEHYKMFVTRISQLSEISETEVDKEVTDLIERGGASITISLKNEVARQILSPLEDLNFNINNQSIPIQAKPLIYN